MAPDRDLWFDKGKQKSYSHPVVRRADSREFMDRQLRAGLAVRGWLETAYYLLGADFTASSDAGALSYMAAMGGWGILDYGLNFAASPYDWLQLGYASYLSSWALMNTGTSETNYGYWAPGPENDGAAGWQFMTAKWGRAWIRKEVPRGAWPYDGEIDLGFGAALRMAATIVVRDPVFDWLAYGGALEKDDRRLKVIPRDGLRKRFAAIVEPAVKAGVGAPDLRRTLQIELSRDGFAAEMPILLDEGLGSVSFTLESTAGGTHPTELRLSWRGPGAISIRQDGQLVKTLPSGNKDYPLAATLVMQGPFARVEIEIR
jgi:hypothetical protein